MKKYAWLKMERIRARGVLIVVTASLLGGCSTTYPSLFGGDVATNDSMSSAEVEKAIYDLSKKRDLHKQAVSKEGQKN